MNSFFKLLTQKAYYLIAFLLAALIFLISCGKTEDSQPQADAPNVVATNQIEAGRYIAIIGGCNDCHTEGYLQSEGKVPEEDWLAGSMMGWQGGWGTTYASNLRLVAQELTEEEWLMVVHERSDLPPMPWMNVNQMSEKDTKALYQYIKSLGPKGEHVPDALEPGVEPKTPYLSLIPKNLPQK